MTLSITKLSLCPVSYECHVLFIVMQNVIMLSVFMLNVIILSVIMLRVVADFVSSPFMHKTAAFNISHLLVKSPLRRYINVVNEPKVGCHVEMNLKYLKSDARWIIHLRLYSGPLGCRVPG